MNGIDAQQRIDPEALAQLFGALADPVRLRLLLALAQPQRLEAVRVPADGADQNGANVATARLQKHVKALQEIGVVNAKPEVEDGKVNDYFRTNPRQLFAMSEELRLLAPSREAADAGIDGTLPGPPQVRARLTRDPSLLLVRGLGEGRRFLLAGGEMWTVGRKQGCDVRLDYDPYASQLQCRVARADGAFWLHDEAAARNRTTVNLVPMQRGALQLLAPGDVVGVGRSLLVFQG